jgi:hypothetical protein
MSILRADRRAGDGVRTGARRITPRINVQNEEIDPSI